MTEGRAGIARLLSPTSPRGAAVLLVAAVTAAHVTVVGFVGLGTDEAHYALYGRLLDWSYFDHPPLVGWVSALAQLVGTGSLALRSPAILLSLLTAWLVWRLSRRLFPGSSPRQALLAVGLFESGLMFHGMGMALLPEDLLLVFGLGAMLALLAVLEHGRLSAWLALGACLGLAGLSKYTAVLLVLTVVTALLAERRVADLRRPGPWLAVALALLLVSPVFAWNASRDWISFRYQIHHGASGDGWSPLRFAESQAIPLLAYSPALVIFALAALVAGLREWSVRGVRLTLALAWPVLLLFGAASGTELSLPHWTALAWAGSAPLAARWIGARWQRPWVRRLVKASFGWSLLVLLLLHSLLISPWLPFPPYRQPLAALTGWDQAALHARQLQSQMAATPGPPPHLFCDNWSRGSRLAWYARPEPVQVLDGRTDQFDLWFGNPAPGDRGLLVAWDGKGSDELPNDLQRFEHHELLDQLPITIAGVPAARFRFYACEGYRGKRP